MEDFTSDNMTSLATFHFIIVEDKPLMEFKHKLTLVCICFIVLIVGIMINLRIFNILANRSRAAAMDKLLKSNNIISLSIHPLILTYYIASNLVAPLSDYIGTIGCLLSVHIIDVFARFYNFSFPVSVALLRYLFVVEHIWVKAKGMSW